MKQLNAAIDFSTGELYFAVENSVGKLLIDSSLKMSGRDSSKMLPWINEKLEENSCSFSDIGHWTCGMGPGSFTGLRIVAALISGLTFNNKGDGESLVRGVPSAIAIAEKAAECSEEFENIGVLYDGRRGELFCFPVKKSGETFFPSEKRELPVVSKDNCSALDRFDLLVGMVSEKEALLKVLPSEYSEKVVFLNSFPVRELMKAENFPWDRDSLLNPVYLRPPVHVKPAEIRKEY